MTFVKNGRGSIVVNFQFRDHVWTFWPVTWNFLNELLNLYSHKLTV